MRTAREIGNVNIPIEKKIEGKLRFLKFNSEETSKIVESEDLKAIERQASVLDSIIDKLHEFKLQVQEIKIESKVGPTEVRNWTQEFENKVAAFEEIAKQAKVAAGSIKSEEEEKRQEIKRK